MTPWEIPLSQSCFVLTQAVILLVNNVSNSAVFSWSCFLRRQLFKKSVELRPEFVSFAQKRRHAMSRTLFPMSDNTMKHNETSGVHTWALLGEKQQNCWLHSNTRVQRHNPSLPRQHTDVRLVQPKLREADGRTDWRRVGLRTVPDSPALISAEVLD